MSQDQQNENAVPFHVAETKQWRKELDSVLQKIKERSILHLVAGSQTMRQMTPEEIAGQRKLMADQPPPCRQSRERSLCITKLQEAIMWLGMDLKEQDAPNPYPNSYNPLSPVIDKTADGLKL